MDPSSTSPKEQDIATKKAGGNVLGSSTPSNNGSSRSSSGGAGAGAALFPPLSPDDLRRKRLETLARTSTSTSTSTSMTASGSGSTTPAVKAPPSTTTATTAAAAAAAPVSHSNSNPNPNPSVSFHPTNDGYDEDAELQRALAMSLEVDSGTSTRTSTSTSTAIDIDATTSSEAALAPAPAPATRHDLAPLFDKFADDDEDAQLAAALRLSMQDQEQHTTTTTTSNNNSNNSTGEGGNSSNPQTASDGDAVMTFSVDAAATSTTMSTSTSTSTTTSTSSTINSTAPPLLLPIPPIHVHQLSPRVKYWYDTATPTNILDMHYILWDTGTTTKNDQQRWLAQGIDFKCPLGSTTTTPTPTPTPTTTPNGQSSNTDTNTNIAEDAMTIPQESLLAAIIANTSMWGLTQAHGGPCGVLAAMQAELMRLLLFGPRTSDDRLPVHIPTHLTNHFCQSPPDLSPPFLSASLALSIGILLARAALQPSATLNDDGTTTTTTTSTSTSTTNANANSANSTSLHLPSPTVQLVLPKAMQQKMNTNTNNDDDDDDEDDDEDDQSSLSELTWQHLEPWSDNEGGSGQSDHLVTYMISLDEQLHQHQHQHQDYPDALATTPTPTCTTPTNTTTSQESQHSKRQKKLPQDAASSSTSTNTNTSTSTNTSTNTNTISIPVQEELLAQAVAAFLLETEALTWFHRPGGVLLLVLSLVASRGVANLQGDMDDPTARLTSQFGHCSQELINLLLTGQAVSNVFDNTLRPSGELICRGIQRRPVIGYLSQLESMRYLEVGGYYKTPQFPIWVVGSTSHFTVLFGDAACLQESASDVLLENVRRAFKQMDGGEENGFIQTSQLTDFLNRLDLLPTIGEHGVATLAATIEVAGAGIILWEDLWKRVSRLLTGASLEVVLSSGLDDDYNDNDNDGVDGGPPPLAPAAEPPLLLANYPSSLSSTPSTDALMSDEEYARLLQVEWNGTGAAGTTTTTTTNSINNHHHHNNNNNIGLEPTPFAPAASATTTNAQTVTGTSATQQKETFGTTFQLYHYNGLRGGNMKPFRVTRLSADEAIGASVSLGSNSNASTNMMMGHGDNGGLEDVLRTKWPSCKINWLGAPPPSID